PTQGPEQQGQRADPAQGPEQQGQRPDPAQGPGQQGQRPDPAQGPGQQGQRSDPAQGPGQQGSLKGVYGRAGSALGATAHQRPSDHSEGIERQPHQSGELLH